MFFNSLRRYCTLYCLMFRFQLPLFDKSPLSFTISLSYSLQTVGVLSWPAVFSVMPVLASGLSGELYQTLFCIVNFNILEGLKPFTFLQIYT